MTRLSKIVLSRIIRKAKELSDEEILDLYHKVKEKLDTQTKSEDQVLDGEHSGPAPQEEQDSSLIQPDTSENVENKQEDSGADEEIDDLLESLGLGDSEGAQPTEEEEKTATVEEPPAVSELEQVPVLEKTDTVQEMSSEEITPDVETVEEQDVTGSEADEALINKITDQVVSDPEYDVKNFKVASLKNGDAVRILDGKEKGLTGTIDGKVKKMVQGKEKILFSIKIPGKPRTLRTEDNLKSVKNVFVAKEFFHDGATVKITKGNGTGLTGIIKRRFLGPKGLVKWFSVEVEGHPVYLKLPNEFEVIKTATRGLQVNRKDKDLMADGIVKPKYETPDIKPPRTDCRDPNGERYKKNDKNRDPEIDNDPDLK